MRFVATVVIVGYILFFAALIGLGFLLGKLL